MGEVVELAEARQRRSERRRAIAETAAMHPALRWLARADSAAHRRLRNGFTLCGKSGPLQLATREAPPCPVCYPWSRARA